MALSISTSVLLISCISPAPQQPITPSPVPGQPVASPSAGSTQGTTPSASSSTPFSPVTNPLPGGVVPVTSTGSGGVCTPLIAISGIKSDGKTVSLDKAEVVSGYMKLTSSLSCPGEAQSVQYMYRLLPVGNLTPIGGVVTGPEYSYQLNTQLLSDGNYELVTKVLTKNGQVLFSPAMKLQISNTISYIGVSGGGGGGGGGVTPSTSATPVPTATPTTTPTTPPATGNVIFDVNTAFNVPQGTQKWSLSLPQQASSTPIVDSNGNSFFAAGNMFYVYGPDGVKKGELSLGNTTMNVTAPVALFNNTVYFGDSSGRVHAINISNPNAPVQKNNFPVTLSGSFEYNAPAIDCSGNIYIHTSDRKLMKVDGTTGASQTLLTISVTGFPSGATTAARYAAPVVDPVNNRVFTGSQNGIRITGLNGGAVTSFIPSTVCDANGCNVPATPLDQAINSPVAVDNTGKGYATSETGTLFKFDPATGQELWRVFVGDGDNGPVIGSDGTVYVASENGILRAMDPDTGDTLFEFGLGNVVEFSTPAIGKGANGEDILYVGTEGGLLYAINGTNATVPGSQRFVKNLGGPIRSSITIGPDGTVYAGTLDGRMYSVYGDSTGLSDTAQWARLQGGANGTGLIGACP